jgi:hypothetical protein
MADKKPDNDPEAIREWYTKLLDNVVKEMISLKAVSGAAVQAAPVWAAPTEMLMAKVWGVGSESDFVWTLSIDKFIADYIAGSLATTPREAAQHFSMKWQMDAERLAAFAKSEKADAKSEEKIKENSAKLIQYAEFLYDLTTRDEVWQEQPPLAD